MNERDLVNDMFKVFCKAAPFHSTITKYDFTLHTFKFKGLYAFFIVEDGAYVDEAPSVVRYGLSAAPAELFNFLANYSINETEKLFKLEDITFKE